MKRHKSHKNNCNTNLCSTHDKILFPGYYSTANEWKNTMRHLKNAEHKEPSHHSFEVPKSNGGELHIGSNKKISIEKIELPAQTHVRFQSLVGLGVSVVIFSGGGG